MKPPHQWLDRIYPLAQPFDSLEEWERAAGADLAAMSTAELRRELGRVRLRLMLDLNSPEWLLNWLAQLQGALRGR
jgi:hypothetical protein